MKIINYKFTDTESYQSFCFSKVEFSDLNLIVGTSGSGKTRFLNTLFNLAIFVSLEAPLKNGSWEIEFTHNNNTFYWELYIKDLKVKKEILINKTNNSEIYRRESKLFKYIDRNLPILPTDKIGLCLLNEDNQIISQIVDGFKSFFRRSFAKDFIEPENKNEININDISEDLPKYYNYSIDCRLYAMKKKFPKKYNELKEYIKDIFPFILEFEFNETFQIGNETVIRLLILEKSVESKIPFNELSSGIKKVFQVLTDLYSLKEKGGVYLLDEYENSLGINAINFLPEIIDNTLNNNQLFITSHHPYIINNIPIENWLVFSREGSNINILYGKDVKERYGASKQESFIKLINDSFYTRDTE